MEEQHAKQFHEFLFSKRNGGPGLPPASSSEFDRQRSASLASVPQDSFLSESSRCDNSPRAGSKRSFSDLHHNGGFPDDSDLVVTRLKADMLEANRTVDESVETVHRLDDELTPTPDDKSNLDDQSEQDDDVEFVGIKQATASPKSTEVERALKVRNELNIEDHDSEEVEIIDTKPAPISIHDEEDEEDYFLDDEIVSNSPTKESEELVEEADMSNEEDFFDEQEIQKRMKTRINPNVDMLLRAAEQAPEPQVDAMRILADATEEERELEEDSEADADEDIAMIFTSMKETRLRDSTGDILAFAAKDLEMKAKKPFNLVEAMVCSRLPELPCEPNYDFSTVTTQREVHAKESKFVPLDVKEPVVLQQEEEEFEEPLYYLPIDPWFPSNNAIKREKKKRMKNDDSTVLEISVPNGKKIKVSSCMHKRLSKRTEPGVIDKLPHCMIHERQYQAQYGKLSKEPFFCMQVTEIYCNSPMICCSICSSWRHAECGGHHTFYSPKMAEENFVPVCDRCYKEKPLMNTYPQAEKRIARQRDIHLRKTNAAGDIIRHAAYAKHGGTYNWPLGSVSSSHIAGHSRSVQIRNERSEKQWKDMISKLNNPSSGKTRGRTKELERVLNNLEEAEGKTDRHNMILFLDRDSQKRYPAGFENPQLNFFDHEEDHVRLACLTDKAAKTSLKNLMMVNDVDPSSSDSESSDCQDDEDDDVPNALVNDKSEPMLGRTKIASTKKPKASKYCIHQRCKRKPRFDSSFCSDACGVSVMETDLVRSLSFANNMHPFHLRN